MPTYRRAEPENKDPYQAQPLPIRQPVAVYYRQSSEAQIGNISTTLQTVDMVEHLVRLGWAPESVIMIDMDAGISGMKTIEERPGMSRLYTMIENQAIGAVAAQDVDRFFRDLTQIQTNIFIDACRRNNVVVLTPTMVYDFSHATQGRYHMQMFREQAQRAADYLEFHIKGRLVKSRRWRQQRGMWTGRPVAPGYVVDLRATLPDGSANPDHRKYVPFEPYATAIRHYFELFRQYNGVCAHAGQHIQEHGPFFPEVTPEMVPEGFKFNSRMTHRSAITGKWCPASASLSHFLTNVVYIGHWVHRGVIVQWDNHEPIVPLDLFMYAFNRLSKTDFFGDPNPDYQPHHQYKRQPKATRREPYPTYAGLIFSDDMPHKPHQRLAAVWNNHSQTYQYNFYEPGGRSNIWNIRAHFLDPVVDDILLDRLQATTLDEHLWQEALHEVRSGNRGEVQRLERAVQQEKQEQSNVLAALGHLSNPELIRRAEAAFETAQQRIEQLERELEAARHLQRHEKIILQSRPALQKIADQWERVPRTERRNLFEAFAEHIKLHKIGRYNKEITVHWHDGSQSTGYIRTHNRFGDYWRQAELEELRELVDNNVEQVEILKTFPEYTWRQLMQKYAYHFTEDRRYSGVYHGHKRYPNNTRWADTHEYRQASQHMVSERSSVTHTAFPNSKPEYKRQIYSEVT